MNPEPPPLSLLLLASSTRVEIDRCRPPPHTWCSPFSSHFELRRTTKQQRNSVDATGMRLRIFSNLGHTTTFHHVMHVGRPTNMTVLNGFFYSGRPRFLCLLLFAYLTASRRSWSIEGFTSSSFFRFFAVRNRSRFCRVILFAVSGLELFDSKPVKFFSNRHHFTYTWCAQ